MPHRLFSCQNCSNAHVATHHVHECAACGEPQVTEVPAGDLPGF